MAATVTWPISKKPNDLDETTVNRKMQSEFEKGYVQSRPKFTRPRKKFTLTWDETPHNPLTDSEKKTLDQFFKDHGAETILFPHPFEDGNSYEVLFEDDNISFSLIYKQVKTGENLRYWSATINLIEQ